MTMVLLYIYMYKHDCGQEMDLLRVWVSKEETRTAEAETSHEFASTVNFDDQATAQLLQLVYIRISF